MLILLITTPNLISQDAFEDDSSDLEDEFITSNFQEEISDEVDKGYDCLEKKLAVNCGNTNNIQELSFNLLAISYDSKLQLDCKTSLKTKAKNNCWGDTGSSNCKIKPTAMATLALNNIGENIDKYKEWLLTKRKSNTGLTWFLEIDADNQTECTINGRTINIASNKKIEGSDPSGLRKAYNNYWFEITDIGKNYTISCDEDFLTTLLYQKQGSSVFYISSETKSAPSYDSITEKVKSYCFTTSSACNYEASLWAALALAKIGEDISPYLPYISAMSDDSQNKPYLPPAFLYMLTRADDYYSEIITQQKQNKFWEESNDRLYDTAIALLALESTSIEEVENTKKYLFSIQEESGCWNSNTAAILYSGWPKETYFSPDSTTPSDCLSFGYYCVSPLQCDLPDTLTNFYCPSLSSVCCRSGQEDLTCSEKQGILCSAGEECLGDEVIAADTNYCCLDECGIIEDQNECEQAGYICKSECPDYQTEKTAYSGFCDFGNFCCGDKEDESGGLFSSWWIIILLILLILIIIMAIIFRDRLRVMIFKKKNKVKEGKGPGPLNRPSTQFPPFSPPTESRLRTSRQPIRRPISRSRKSTMDKDFDETMKNLKEMSK